MRLYHLEEAKDFTLNDLRASYLYTPPILPQPLPSTNNATCKIISSWSSCPPLTPLPPRMRPSLSTGSWMMSLSHYPLQTMIPVRLYHPEVAVPPPPNEAESVDRELDDVPQPLPSTNNDTCNIVSSWSSCPPRMRPSLSTGRWMTLLISRFSSCTVTEESMLTVLTQLLLYLIFTCNMVLGRLARL